MKNQLLIAASAAVIVLATPAFAQESAPGTSVQTGAAASAGSDSSMSAKPKGKKAMHANTSAAADSKTAITGPYGTSMAGGVPNNAQTTTSQGMTTSGANASSKPRSN